MITKEEFIEYFSNISAYIDDDEEFVRMISLGFSVDPSQKPPPPDYATRKGALRENQPKAKKVHGDLITWNQEPSTLEATSGEMTLKKKVYVLSYSHWLFCCLNYFTVNSAQ